MALCVSIIVGGVLERQPGQVQSDQGSIKVICAHSVCEISFPQHWLFALDRYSLLANFRISRGLLFYTLPSKEKSGSRETKLILIFNKVRSSI